MNFSRSALAFLLLIAAVSTVLTSTAVVIMAADASPLASRFSNEGMAFINKHCIECHGDKDPKADLNLVIDKDADSIVKRRSVWENVVEMASNGQMPPHEKPRPDQAEIDQFIGIVNGLFDEIDLHAKPDPGRVTVRRLNRTEYNNTVRDLMMIDFNAAEDFPSDDIGHGFDNIGDVLTMSPVLMERYLAAAESIVQKAILIGEPPKPPKRRSVATFLQTTQKEAFEVPFRKLDTVGKLSISHKLTVEGEYKFRFRGWGRQVGDEPVKVAFQVDDNDIETVEVKATGQDKDKRVYEAKPVQIGSGEHRISVTFLNEFADAAVEKPEEAKRALFVEWFELEGPSDMVPLSHKRLLACQADKLKPDQAREILTRFVSRAYRRPATPAEVERLVVLVTNALDEGLIWEAAIQRAMQAVLVSPKFLFRLELDDRPENPEPNALDEFQLASRMSYFLWSSMPDDELFALAGKGELTPNIDAQVRRMLADPKSNSLVDNFAMQWLQLRRLKTITPDPKAFPTFNEGLRSAMLKETELFIQAIIREDRSINQLIDADFTFVNRPLAQHYGLESAMSKPPEGERRGRHAAVSDGHEVGHPGRRLSLQQRDRVGATSRGELRLAGERCARTRSLALGRTFG